LNEVLDFELKQHYLLEHGGLLEICMELRMRHGRLTARRVELAKRFALINMELIVVESGGQNSRSSKGSAIARSGQGDVEESNSRECT
jgi:hypothetical protein